MLGVGLGVVGGVVVGMLVEKLLYEGYDDCSLLCDCGDVGGGSGFIFGSFDIGGDVGNELVLCDIDFGSGDGWGGGDVGGSDFSGGGGDW